MYFLVKAAIALPLTFEFFYERSCNHGIGGFSQFCVLNLVPLKPGIYPEIIQWEELHQFEAFTLLIERVASRKSDSIQQPVLFIALGYVISGYLFHIHLYTTVKIPCVGVLTSFAVMSTALNEDNISGSMTIIE